MKKFFSIALALSFSFSTIPAFAAPARLHCDCESVGQYTPPKGVYRLYRRKINKRWETKYHCLPCGRKNPYEVLVVTYKERYSNGTIRIWDCALTKTERALYSK